MNPWNVIGRWAAVIAWRAWRLRTARRASLTEQLNRALTTTKEHQ